VADVNSYKLFLPWCKDSLYLREAEHKSMVRLVVGFPPLMESYTALVLADPPHSLRVWNHSINSSRTKNDTCNSWPFPRPSQLMAGSSATWRTCGSLGEAQTLIQDQHVFSTSGWG